LRTRSKKVSTTGSWAVVLVHATLSAWPIRMNGPPTNSIPIAPICSRLRFSAKCMMEGVSSPVCGKPPSQGCPVAERALEIAQL
jgi:hypothetical protein